MKRCCTINSLLAKEKNGEKEDFRLVKNYCAVNMNSSTLSGIGSSGHMNPRLARILVCCNAIVMD